MGKLAVVVGKSKKKSLKKKVPIEKPSKFISQALNNKKKSKGKKRKRPKTRGLVYVKNLPHGFFEEQLRSYFSQFGAVTRIRLGRSPKTLNSRGYAFIEFRYPEVAQIAAETMNNYIMFHRIVKAKFIPPDEIKHDVFRSSIMTIRKDGEKMLTSKSILAKEAVVKSTNKLMTDDDQKNRIDKVRSRVNKQKEKLASLGIDFDIDMVAKNMSEEVIKPIVKKPVLTIDNLNEEDLDGDNDETFDPSKLEIDSADEIQDFEYDTADSENDDVVEEDNKKQKAIEVARRVSTRKQKEKEDVTKVEKIPVPKKKSPKNKKSLETTKQPEKPAKKSKAAQKTEEQNKAVEKPAKKSKAAQKTEEQNKAVEKPAKKLKEVKKVIEKPAKKIKEVEAVVEKVEKAATNLRTRQKVQPVQEEKIVKKLKEKKTTKLPQEKSAAPKTKDAGKKAAKNVANESPKLKKVSKVSKGIKKAAK